ncbi:Uncharacterised protein [Segatella buccae]|uniref:Uncharacterized protein n=1 Tax=Segatella buccae TaxID=28126 RepID=A0AAQ1UIB2_9BACT|nr:Uncharacterised protein [Segatella buccae]
MQIGNEKNIQKTHTTFLKSPTNNRPLSLIPPLTAYHLHIHPPKHRLLRISKC